MKERAVIYARYSSHNQREESIEGQLRVCHDYATRHGYLVVEEYTDHAISGKTDKRPAFQRMVHDAKSKTKTFDVLLVYNFDRFARNKEDSAIYKRQLRKAGVKVISATQPLTDQPEDIILESLLEGMAEYYSANLARNVRRGMTENALKAKPNGLLPLGYKNVDGTIVLDPVESNAVKMMFDLYDQGFGPKYIQEEMAKLHVMSKHGNPITFQSIRSILSNPRYTGKYIYGGTVVEGGLPVIVDGDLFNRVQEKMKSKRRKKRKADDTQYLLTGKLFCGQCKSPMTGECGTSKNKTLYHYYKCSNAKRKRGCHKKTIRKEQIEEKVLAAIRTEILTEENIMEIAERTVEVLEQEAKDNSLLSAYTDELNQVEMKIENLNDAIANGIWGKSTMKTLNALEQKQEELQELIALEQARHTAITVEDVKDWLRRMKTDGLSDSLTDQALIDAFVTEVYLYDPDEHSGKKQRVLIKYNTSGAAEKNGIAELTIESCSSNDESGTPFLCQTNTVITATCLIRFDLI